MASTALPREPLVDQLGLGREATMSKHQVDRESRLDHIPSIRPHIPDVRRYPTNDIGYPVDITRYSIDITRCPVDAIGYPDSY